MSRGEGVAASARSGAPYLLREYGDLGLIDHGAPMIWRHHWPGARTSAERLYGASGRALTTGVTFGPDVRGATTALTPLVTEEPPASRPARR